MYAGIKSTRLPSFICNGVVFFLIFNILLNFELEGVKRTTLTIKVENTVAIVIVEQMIPPSNAGVLRGSPEKNKN